MNARPNRASWGFVTMSALRTTLGSAALAAAMAVSGPALSADLLTAPVDPVFDEVFARQMYIEARIGAPLPSDVDVTFSTGPTGEYDADSGLHIAALLGMYFTPNWRGDIGFSWTRASDGNFAFTGGGPIPHAGDTNIYTFMANVYYGFDMGGAVSPFVGGGLGFSIFDVDNLGAVGGAFTVDDSDTTFTAAFHAGLDVDLTENVILTGRYSLVYNSDATFSTAPVGVGPATVNQDSAFHHVLSAGLRVLFDSPFN